MIVLVVKFEVEGDGCEIECEVDEYIDIVLFSGDFEDVFGDIKVFYN